MVDTGHIQHDVSELDISRCVIRRARLKHPEFTSEVKATFAASISLMLHWNGIIMEAFTGPGR